MEGLKGFELRQKRWLKLIKDFDYVIDSHLGKGNVVADVLNRKSSSYFIQIRVILTSIQDKLRSWPIELITDGNDFLVAHLKVKPIYCEMIWEAQNNDLTMVRLTNYIDSWIILRIEDRLDFDLWRSWKFWWIVIESMIMYINCNVMMELWDIEVDTK